MLPQLMHAVHLELRFEARDAGHRRLLGADDKALLDFALLNASQPKLQVLAPLSCSHLHVVPVDGVDGDRHPARQGCLTEDLGAALLSLQLITTWRRGRRLLCAHKHGAQ